MEAIFIEQDTIRLRVEKRVEALQKGYRQNVGLIGPSGFGKTHLLQTIFQSLAQQSELLVIYMHAEALNFDAFVERWIGAVLSSFYLNQKVTPPGDFQTLVREAAALLPKTIDKIQHVKKMLRRGERGGAAVRELFSITGTLADETGKKIVLMIDEFHALEALPVTDPFVMLGKEIMVEKETLYFVASSKPQKAREIFNHRLSLLFGNFEVFEVAPLNYHETREFLSARSPHLSFVEIQKIFLLRMTDGIPLYLELLLDQLERVLISRDTDIAAIERDGLSEISTEYLIETFHRELFDQKGRLAQLYEKRLEACRRYVKDGNAMIHILLAISAGRRKLLGIATFIERKMSEVKKMLERLVQDEVIRKRGSFYMIEDFLFRFWLIEVYQRRQQIYYPNERRLRDSFRQAVRQTFEKIEKDARTDITASVEGLFKEFRNDLIEVNQRRWRCPQFSELAFRPSNGRFFPLHARSDKGRWVCQIASEVVCEEDITFFLDELKRFRKGVQKKIIIALEGIEQNAKLMAQEAQIQLWDIHNFNALLDLYNLPKVVYSRELHESNLGAVAQGVSQAG